MYRIVQSPLIGMGDTRQRMLCATQERPGFGAPALHTFWEGIVASRRAIWMKPTPIAYGVGRVCAGVAMAGPGMSWDEAVHPSVTGITSQIRGAIVTCAMRAGAKSLEEYAVRW